jgi:membrane-associated protease RseP (regulator of RpoE activity)
MSTPERQPRAMPLFALPLALLVLVLLAFGVVRAVLVLNGTGVVVAAKSATAGQYLEKDDLRIEELDGYTVDDDTIMKKVDDAVGHVVRDALAEGSPISKADITVMAKLQLRFRTEDVTIGDVKTGQRVQLLFAPIGAAGAPQAQAIQAILIAHPEDGEDGMVWVAIAAVDRDALLSRLARSRLIIASAR